MVGIHLCGGDVGGGLGGKLCGQLVALGLGAAGDADVGEHFGDCCDDVYGTIGEAIREWTSKTGIEQGERTDEQMMDFINEYEYEDDDTYFYIRTFTFE
jgi:hypothetical protein